MVFFPGSRLTCTSLPSNQITLQPFCIFCHFFLAGIFPKIWKNFRVQLLLKMENYRTIVLEMIDMSKVMQNVLNIALTSILILIFLMIDRMVLDLDALLTILRLLNLV